VIQRRSNTYDWLNKAVEEYIRENTNFFDKIYEPRVDCRQVWMHKGTTDFY
jgi:hypothetical protein